MLRAFEFVLRFVLFCALALFIQTALLAQQVSDGNNATQPASMTPAGPAIDFEVMVAPRQGGLVRRKGTQGWTLSSKLVEPTAVGLLDGNHPIYVVTKAVKPPKAKRMPDPN